MGYLPLSNLGILTNQNYLTNPDAENSLLTTGFNVGSVTLSSGVPTGAPTIGAVTAFSLSRDTTNKLVGGASFKISAGIASGTTPAGAAIVSDIITISDADLAKVLSFGFTYKLVTDGAVLDFSGTSTQSVELWVYNIGLAAWSQPAGFRGINTKNAVGQVTSTFQTDSSNASNKNQYRLAIIFKGAISSLTELVFDEVFLGDKPALYGAPVTDWVSYTPTFTGFGTVATQTFWYRRIGDSVEIKGRFTAGTTTGVEARITLPSALTSDPAKVNGVLELAGKLDVNRSGTTFFSSGTVLIEPSVNYLTFGLEASTINGLSKQTGGTILASGEIASLYAKVPILGWSSSVQMSNDTDTRVVAAKFYRTTATGTLTAVVDAVVPWTVAEVDTHNGWDSSATYTVPVSGVYKISGNLCFTLGASNQQVQAKIYIDGVLTDIPSITNGTASLANVSCPFSTIKKLNAGQTIRLYAYASGSGTVITSDGNKLTQISIERLSGPSAIAATESVAMRAINTAGTSISAVSLTQVPFATKTYDSHGAWSGSVYTVPVSGKYHVNCHVYYAFASWVASSPRSIQLVKAGSASVTDYMTLYVNPSAYTGLMGLTGSTTIDVLAGDTLSITLQHNEAAARSLDATPGVNTLTITRVGN